MFKILFETEVFSINIFPFQVGFEPTTQRLTAVCSTTELLKIGFVFAYNFNVEPAPTK